MHLEYAGVINVDFLILGSQHNGVESGPANSLHRVYKLQSMGRNCANVNQATNAVDN